MNIKQSNKELALLFATIMYLLNIAYIVSSYFLFTIGWNIVTVLSIIGVFFPPLGAIMGLFHFEGLYNGY